MAKVLVMRYDKGKVPPSAVTDEFKQALGGALGKYLEENPQVKFNGLYVNEAGTGICDWKRPTRKRLRNSSTAPVALTTKSSP